MKRLDTLDAARAAITHREVAYGSPRENFDRIAAIWQIVLSSRLRDGEAVNATDVALMMVAVKLARLVETPDHADSAIDLAGYAALLTEVV